MDSLQEALAYNAMDHSQPNASFLTRLKELGAFGRMLDIGTGPADIPILACQQIPALRSVLAIDLSCHMLALASNKIRRAGLDHRIHLLQADAKRLPFPDASFDTVASNTILHHLPDPSPFLQEACRVLRPNGVLLIRDLYRPDSHQKLEELVALHTPGATPDQKQLFRQSLLAALTVEELRQLLHQLHLPGLHITIDSDRHMSVQKSAHH